MNDPECIFCKIAAGIIPTDFLYQDERVVAFRDINPRAPHHVLIIPREHLETVLDLSDESLAGHLTLVAGTVARELGLDANGFRLVYNCGKYAGQDVLHIHLHLLGGRRLGWPPG